MEKLPYVIVWGDKESDEAIAVREHGGAQSTTVSQLDELRREPPHCVERGYLCLLKLFCPLTKQERTPLPHLPGTEPIGGSTE